MTRRARGQVLVFYALVLPIVLLPVAAYVVDAATLASRHAALQAATAEVTKTAAQHIDVNSLRATGSVRIDGSDIQVVVARALASEQPAAVLDSVSVHGAEIEVVTSESVALPLPVFARRVVLMAHAVARIVPGYDSPSSFLPFSTKTL